MTHVSKKGIDYRSCGEKSTLKSKKNYCQSSIIFHSMILVAFRYSCQY